MSFDPVIGLDLLVPQHREYLARYGVEPTINNIRAMMPPGFKEPEKKILLERSRSFQTIRALFLSGKNTFLLPGQEDRFKDPLVTANIDTAPRLNQEISPGISLINPTAHLMQQGANLRLRFEISAQTGIITQRDFNEKTLMGASQIINGIADRDERELELQPNETLADGYNRFIDAFREQNSPAYADKILFNDLTPYSGIVTARSTYGLAVVHPNHKVMFIFEVCEDRFDTLQENLMKKTSSLFEWEMEPKQVIGKLPQSARSPEGFRRFVYTAMDGIGDYIVARISGARHNDMSKAEISSAHIKEHYGDCYFLEALGVAPVFNRAGEPLTAQQFALMNSLPLEPALEEAYSSLKHRASRLHEERIRYTDGFSRPDIAAIGTGAQILHFGNKQQKPRSGSAPQLAAA